MIAADLDDRPINRCDLPTRQERRLLRNQRLLGEPRCGQVPLQIFAPRFQFGVLLLQLLTQTLQAQMRVDSRARSTETLIGFVTKSLAPASRQTTSLSSPPSPVNITTGNCAMAGSGSERKRAHNFGAVKSRHAKIKQQQRRNFFVQKLKRLDARPAPRDRRSRRRSSARASMRRLARSSSMIKMTSFFLSIFLI